jgi:VanZ family protein
MRKLCLAYWLLLTALLLVRNPFDWLPGRGSGSPLFELIKTWLHLLSFLALGFLVFWARWKLSHAWLVALLAIYAVATEVVQGFVGRNPELADLWQDFAGIAAGTAIAWGLRWLRGPAETERDEAHATDLESFQTPRRR